MSETTPTVNEQKLQLEIQKLAKELEKLTVEIPKIRRESGWRATLMPSVVSLAAVFVTAVVSVASIMNVRQGQQYDRERADREFAVNCVNSASSVANLVFDKADGFDKLTPAGKINFANVVLVAYPPRVASRFLRALAPRIDTADTQTTTAFQIAFKSIEDQSDTAFPCPAVTDAISTTSQNVSADVVPSAPPTPAPGPGPVPPSAPVAVETVAPRLTTYYQVTRSAERGPAEAVARAVEKTSKEGAGSRFPSAGVEVVSGSASVTQTQVRYYHRDQEDAALQLLALVQNAAHQQAGRVVFIGGTFPNLPRDRIEVWLAPLPPGTNFCYQEEDQHKPAAQRYLTLCQPSKEQCDKARGPNNSAGVSQSACEVVDLAVAPWKPMAGGIEGARYQYSATPFGAPFPRP